MHFIETLPLGSAWQLQCIVELISIYEIIKLRSMETCDKNLIPLMIFSSIEEIYVSSFAKSFFKKKIALNWLYIVGKRVIFIEYMTKKSVIKVHLHSNEI